ncbi:hypothetical protein scyTo_0011141 [Scyliorhinus torazame]|uniref:Uncharacterized protein n=1 Tax=Scyliorhinus torazame TaxID=75743 RepID=A0A401NHY2_SCYTO|nr:hypothetical protein [Scyliorhinus torazame]
MLAESVCCDDLNNQLLTDYSCQLLILAGIEFTQASVNFQHLCNFQHLFNFQHRKRVDDRALFCSMGSTVAAYAIARQQMMNRFGRYQCV